MLTNLGLQVASELGFSVRQSLGIRLRRNKKRNYFPQFGCSSNSPDETCMLRNPLHVAHTPALNGPTQRVMRVRIPISPPASLNRRETAPPFAAKYAKMPVFRNISSATRTGENGLLGIERRQSTGLSLEGTGAVRFQRLYRANATRSQTDDVAKVT